MSMSNTPVIQKETSPLSSEVSSSNSIEDSSLSINQKTQLDLMLEMLTEMRVSQDEMKEGMKANQEEVNLRLTRLEEKDGKSPREKVSSSLLVDVVTAE